MATIRKIPVAWQTGAGGSGVSVFYCLSSSDLTPALGTFFTSVRAFFPTAVSWSIPASGDLIAEDSGFITGLWTGGTAATITGQGATAYAAGTGGFIRWGTGGIAGSRRVRGRTFMAPLLSSMYDITGTLVDASVTTFNAAASALVVSQNMVIWHRPKVGTHVGGLSFVALSGQMADKVTSLKTRRS